MVVEAKLPPQHIAIIPDGNRRWARQRGLPDWHGHKVGFLNTLPKLIFHLDAAGIREVTVWMFSTENWERSNQEIVSLMSIFSEFLDILTNEKRVSLQHFKFNQIGRRDRLPTEILNKLDKLCNTPVEDKNCLLNLAIDYGGVDAVARAVSRLIDEEVERIDTEVLRNALGNQGALHSDPDLVIRTSGEMRLSGFMPIEASYSELYFCDAYFPDFFNTTFRPGIGKLCL